MRVPRRTAQDTVCILRIVPILTPLPGVASHIIQPIVICRETPDRTRPRVPIVITFDYGPSGRFVSNPRLHAAVITGSSRRWPRRTPGVKLYLRVFLFRRIPGLRVQSNGQDPSMSPLAASSHPSRATTFLPSRRNRNCRQTHESPARAYPKC